MSKMIHDLVSTLLIIRKKNFQISLILSSFVLVHSFLASNVHAAENNEWEYTIKASFLIKMISFIKWPSNEEATLKDKRIFNICLSGKDPFGKILDLARKEGFIKENIKILRQVQVAHMKNCQIVFISSSTKNRIEEILMKTGNHPILFVGDTQGFAQKGVGLNFFIQNNKVRFEINKMAVENRDIKISSELLNLAVIVN